MIYDTRSSRGENMYNLYFKTQYEETFHCIPNPTSGAWINCEYATIEDLREIASILNIDPSDIQDALDKHEIPRTERSEDMAIVYTRFPYHQEAGYYTNTLTIILTKEYFVTICPSACPFIQNFISHPTTLATSQKSKLLINILLLTIQEYTKVSRQLRALVLTQEKDLNQVTSDDISELTMKEENLTQYLNSLLPVRKVIEEILTGKLTMIYEKDQELLEDLLLATAQAEDMCRLNLRIIRSLRNTVQILFTNQLNKTIKLLTALTIILNFPTMISSLFGMNVTLPFEKSPFTFLFIMLFIIAVSFTAFFFFKKRRWL